MKEKLVKLFRKVYVEKYQPTFMEVYLPHLLILFIIVTLLEINK